jgi:hypothetical protein
MALPSSSRNGARVLWITLHTAEGSRTKEDLYAFFNRNQNSSSHVGIDGYGISPPWVDRSRAAWTLLDGNPVSMNAELCAFASWTRAQWLSTGWVDGCWNPRQIVRNAASWALQECRAFGIGPVYIGTSGVRNRQAGIIDHDDYSDGTGDGDHWDIGESFPWDIFFQDMGLAETDDDMFTEADRGALRRVWQIVDEGTVRNAQLNKDLGFIIEQLSAPLARLESLVSQLHGVIVSGDKRDGRLNQDLGYVLDETRAAVENARANLAAAITALNPPDEPPAEDPPVTNP